MKRVEVENRVVYLNSREIRELVSTRAERVATSYRPTWDGFHQWVLAVVNERGIVGLGSDYSLFDVCECAACSGRRSRTSEN